MSNNIAVSITADVAQLQAKRAIASAELRQLQKDVNDLARMSRTDTDWGKVLAPDLLAAADAAGRAKSQVKAIDDELKLLGPTAQGAHTGIAGIVRELLVLGREGAAGNFHRMEGSAALLAQRLYAVAPAAVAVGSAIAVTALPFIIFGAAVEAGSKELANFQNALEATNGYAGVTISQLQVLAREQAAWAHEGVGAATKSLTELAASGRFTGETLQLVGADATRMAQLTGEGADKWNAQFEKMGDGVAKFAAEYQAKYGQLTTAQFTYIEQLEQQGRKEEAEYQLAKDVYEYLGTRAPQNLGLLEGAWKRVANGISSAWDGLKAFGRDSNIDKIALLQMAIDSQKQWGNGASEAVHQMEAQKAALIAAEQAAEGQAAAQAKATATQKEGVAAAAQLHEKFEASKASGEKLKDALKQINDELAKAKLADPGNAATYEKEAAAARVQAIKQDTPRTGAPSQVAEWRDQLQAQLEDEHNFFADSTAEELAFWQGKVALTKAGSKQRLEVDREIYQLQKTLARQSYDDLVAGLNDQLEASRESWGQEQTIWAEKLAVIGLNFGLQSKEYLTAHKEFEAAERQHQKTMAEIARQGEQERLAELQSSLKTQEEIRNADAQTAEQLIQAQARYSANPLAEIQAAEQVAAMHQQLDQQRLSHLETVYAAENALREQAVARELAANGAEAASYVKAVDDKKKADAAFYAQHQVLEDQLVNRSKQDALKVQQAWHGAIDPVVQSFGSGIKGMLEGTETLTQALAHVGETILDVIITAIERWVAAQIVAMVTGQATGKVAAASQIATNIALAGSGGVASMAAAPFPIDLGAPEFGAAMAATAAAYGSLASFDVGTNSVPADMLALVHAGERIVPAADNAALMSAIGGRGVAGVGDTYNLYHQPNVNYGGDIDLRQVLANQGAHLLTFIARAVRNGELKMQPT